MIGITWNRCMFACVIMNIFIMIAVAFVPNFIQNCDFAAYYNTASDIFKSGFSNTYNEVYFWSLGIMPYRYFPFFLLMVSSLTLLPQIAAYMVFFLISMVFTCACYVYMLKIMKIFHCSPKKEMLMSVFMLVLLPCECLIWGNVANIIGSLAMMSLYYFLTKRELIGCLFLGLTILIKPVLIILVVLVAITLGKKGFFKRVVCLFILLVPDVIIFLATPGLLDRFVGMNFTNGTIHAWYRTGSISFMNIIAMFTDSTLVPQIITFVSCLVIGTIVSKRASTFEMRMLLIFTIGSFGYLIVYPDVWPHQLFFILPFLVIRMLITRERNQQACFVFYMLVMRIGGPLLNYFTWTGILPEMSNTPWSWNLLTTLAEPLFVILVTLAILVSSTSLVNFIILINIERKVWILQTMS